MRIRNFFLALVFISAFAAGVAATWVYPEITGAGPLAEGKLVAIDAGTSVRGIAEKLKVEGVIRDEISFMIAARLAGKDLKAGEYQFTPGIKILDTINLIHSGKTYQHQVTIPEGLMVVEILALLEAEKSLGGVTEDLPAEGTLLPETYNYVYGDTREEMIARMQDAMKKKVAELWPGRDPGLPVSTPEEAVILASIVEKETGVASERPRVAGVFINRLAKGMPLQSDPTVIYAVTGGSKKLDRALTYKDLKIDSPYNTYVKTGLPPTPIANPGGASLMAVLHPERHDFLYFVADGSGGHAFAKSLNEHNKNVVEWRKISK